MSLLNGEDGIYETAWERAMDDLPLSMEIDALVPEPPPPVTDPWAVRRAQGFGASEVCALLIALGRRPADAFGSHPRAQSKRLLARKAGLSRELKRPPEAVRGKELEPRLIAEWRRLLDRGQAGPHAALIDPASVCYVEGLPPAARCLSPVVDRACPVLAASLDVVAFDVFDRLGVLDGKCSREPYGELPPERAARREARHAVQLAAQMACSGAAWGAIVEGERWAVRSGGAVVTHAVLTRDDGLIAEIRDACNEGWAHVARMKEGGR